MLSHTEFTKAITAIAGCDKAARLAVVDKYDKVRRESNVNAARQWLKNEAEKHNSKLHHVLAVVQDDAARRIIQAALNNNDFEKQEYLEARLSDSMIADAAAYLGLDEDKIRAQAPTPLERRRLRFKVKQSISAINRAVGATGGNGYALATPFELAMRQRQKDNQDDWALKTHIYNRETNTILNMAEIMASAGKKKVAEILAIAKGLQDFGDKHNLVPIFYTLTAPPRMHANPTVGRNSYDGTTPRSAQRWIHTKHRTAFQILRDEGIFPAGVRTVEGHKDECPHWHCCAWMPAEDAERFEEVLRSVAESWKSERGCDIKNMSLEVEGKNKAKAISYLFKYILKSIGGLGEDDGVDSELSQSIEQQDCWRAKHGIRGFQFFGLPSLNLWRNLRKSPERMDDELLDEARTAAKNGEGCKFIEAAGGLNLKRKERAISARIDVYENQENEEDNGKFVVYTNRLNGFEITQKLKTWEVINEEEKEELLTVKANHPSLRKQKIPKQTSNPSSKKERRDEPRPEFRQTPTQSHLRRSGDGGGDPPCTSKAGASPYFFELQILHVKENYPLNHILKSRKRLYCFLFCFIVLKRSKPYHSLRLWFSLRETCSTPYGSSDNSERRFMSKSNNHLSKQSGRKNLPFSELRTHSVNVRLNEAELVLLDKVRSRFQRAEAMRMLALTKLPTPILVPEINREMAVNIGRSFGNLATLATAMRAGEYVEISKIKTVLAELQLSLIYGV